MLKLANLEIKVEETNEQIHDCEADAMEYAVRRRAQISQTRISSLGTGVARWSTE